MLRLNVTTLSDSGADGTVTGTVAEEIADGDGLSLREAISFVQLRAGVDLPPDVIVFDNSLSGTLRLIQGQLELRTGSTKIIGNGNIVISGDANGDDIPELDTGFTDVSASRNLGLLSDNSRIFNGASLSMNLALENISLTGGYTPSYVSGSYGGAVFVGGRLGLAQVTIAGNSANAGGGLFAGDLSAVDTTIRNNEAIDGDGGGVFAAGSAEFENSIIANNAIIGNGSGAGVFSMVVSRRWWKFLVGVISSSGTNQERRLHPPRRLHHGRHYHRHGLASIA